MRGCSQDGAALLARAEELLRSATPRDGYVALVAPLLLVSGRREIEILNVCTGRASFERVGARSVLFTGQAKTKCCEGAPAYVIPLLDNIVTFKNRLDEKPELTPDYAVSIAKEAFVSAGERDIYTGDFVEICTITKEGTEKEIFTLKRD